MSRTPWTFGGAPATVGRERLIGTVCSRIADGRGVVLTGSPGIGKSRVLRDVVQGADRQGRAVASLVATHASSTVPLGAFLPVLPGDVDGGSPLATAIRVRDQLLGSGTGLVAVDDAHLLDPASAGLILELARSGVPVLLTLRDAEFVHDAVAALWRGDHADIIEVPALRQDYTHLLVEAQLRGPADRGLSHAVHAKSQGNPLLTRELLRHAAARENVKLERGRWVLVGQLPLLPRVGDLLGLSLESLAPEVRRAVEVVALADTIDVGDACALVGTPALEQAESAALVVTDRSIGRPVLMPAHPLLRDAVLSEMPSLRRDRLLSELIETIGRGVPPALLPLQTRVRIGVWALERGATVPVDELLDLAELVYATDPRLCDRFIDEARPHAIGLRATLRLAHLLAHQHRIGEAILLLDSLSEDDLPAVARLGLLMTRSFVLSLPAQRPDLAMDFIERASMDFGPAPMVEAHRAMALWLLARPVDAIAVAGPLFDDSALPADVRAHAGLTLRAAFTRTHDAPAFDAVGSAIMTLIPLASPELPEVAQALELGEMLFRVEADEIPRAVELGRRGYRVALECGDDALRGQYAHLLGQALTISGDAEAGLPLLREGMVARGVWATATRPMMLTQLTRTLSLNGRLDEARRVLSRLRLEPRAPHFEPYLYLAEMAVMSAGDDADAARDLGLSAGRLTLARGDRIMAGHLLYAAVRLGSRAAARSSAGLLGSLASAAGAAKAAHARALIDSDAEGVEAAAGLLESAGLHWYALEAAAQALELFRATGRHSNAVLVATMMRRLRASCPGIVSAVANRAVLPLSLTPRELEIARRAAQGWSDRRIAEVTGISIRTVGTHLTRVYAKVGTTGRVELAGLITGNEAWLEGTAGTGRREAVPTSPIEGAL